MKKEPCACVCARASVCVCARARGGGGDIVNVSFSKCWLTECLVQQSVCARVYARVCVCERAAWLPGISTLGGSRERLAPH